MESVGNFVFNRKDLLGHGAFAVVFKGRHKENPELEVAVKCISKKKLSSSPSLLGKEIRILKELKHDNIVHLLDFQEISGSVYLVMEFCNGGDLADYLDSKGCLSEDTIRSFLQQIAGAMSILRSKGIIHRDLKPQNILLSYSAGRRVSPHNICIKLADFGFARYLQGNMMAATLCGSPMYMAPEVIMSQNYDAKADLWSVGTIVFQCLTGSTPFQARSPQELRLFYERNRKLNPHIPRETSSHLRDLLCGLLQRNHRKRMDFDAFFNHPFLEASPVVRKCEPSSSKTTLPVPIPLCPNSSLGSSSSGSSTSNPTPIQSEIETPKPHPPHKTTPPSFSELKGFSCSETEDFVMVPTQFLNEMRDQHKQDIGIQTGGSPLYPGFFVGGTPLPSPSICVSPSPIRPMECYGSSYSQSVPIPVPTQIHKYQRMEQNLQGASRTVTPSSPGYCTGGFISPSHRRLFTGWSRPRQLSPKVGTILETSDQSEPQCSRTVSQEEHVRSQNQVFPLFSDVGAMETPLPPGIGSHRHSPHTIVHRWELGRRASLPITLGRTRTMPDLQEPCMTPTKTAERKPQKISYLKRSSSAGQLSDMLLKVVFESQLEKVFSSNSGSPGWKYGKDPKSYTAPERYCCGFTDITASSLFGDIAFEPPELQTETLMEKSHTDTLTQLRFILAFTHCVMGMAAAKDTGIEKNETSDDTVLKQSQLADQISRLSQEWSCAEQLVLYMKCAEFLSSALQTAKEMIEMGKLYPFASVKQVVRKMNELYKECVMSSRSLTARLQLFFSLKQRLMDRMNNITAEKIIYSHTIQMVQDAALDEMFHHGEASVQRYHQALLLLEGLSWIITEKSDLNSIDKYKQSIERRLSSLQSE